LMRRFKFILLYCFLLISSLALAQPVQIRVDSVYKSPYNRLNVGVKLKLINQLNDTLYISKSKYDIITFTRIDHEESQNNSRIVLSLSQKEWDDIPIYIRQYDHSIPDSVYYMAMEYDKSSLNKNGNLPVIYRDNIDYFLLLPKDSCSLYVYLQLHQDDYGDIFCIQKDVQKHLNVRFSLNLDYFTSKSKGIKNISILSNESSDFKKELYKIQ